MQIRKMFFIQKKTFSFTLIFRCFSCMNKGRGKMSKEIYIDTGNSFFQQNI